MLKTPGLRVVSSNPISRGDKIIHDKPKGDNPMKDRMELMRGRHSVRQYLEKSSLSSWLRIAMGKVPHQQGPQAKTLS